MSELMKQTLTQHVNAIKKNEEQAKKNTFEIAVRLNIINTENLWDQELTEYKSMVDFAAAEFGYAKSTTLNYIKLADKFLTVSTNDKGKTDIRTVCAHVETDPKGKEIVTDYGIGQLNAVGKLTPDEFIQADSDGIISPDMSVTSIKKAIKEWLNPVEDTDSNSDSEPNETPEPEETPTADVKRPPMSINDIVKCIFGDYIENGRIIEQNELFIALEICEKLLNKEYTVKAEHDPETRQISRVVVFGNGGIIITEYNGGE